MFVFLILLACIQVCLGQEPVCSKFAYEESLLGKMIRTEIKFEQLQNEFNKISAECRATMDTLQKTVDDFKAERQLNRDTWTDMNQTVLSYLRDFSGMSSELISNVTALAVTPIVAFQATGLKTLSPGKGDVLVFPNLSFNLHDGYDSSTGIFTAPVSGLYLFTVNTCSTAGKYINVEIIAEENRIGLGLTYDYDSSPCNTAVALGFMKMGGSAYVRVFLTNGPMSEDLHRLVSFSGALLNKALYSLENI